MLKRLCLLNVTIHQLVLDNAYPILFSWKRQSRNYTTGGLVRLTDNHFVNSSIKLKLLVFRLHNANNHQYLNRLGLILALWQI